ncbi:MAG TPA: hypothetical protein VF696_01875 [Candidatus Paceibacterota bacterium]|jgi:D-alanyl-D-alanine dipeptidase
METPDFVYLDEHGLLGSNYYWHKCTAHGLTQEDVTSAGVTNDRVLVHKDLIAPLQEVDQELQKRGFRLYVKEGLRPEALYRIVYDRRVEKFGKETTDSLLNMTDMPHAKGLSVDVTLWDASSNTEVLMRRREDGVPSLFVGFYRGKDDDDSRKYQEMQDYLAGIMLERDFRIGTKNEFFHFDYRPGTPPNYV